MKNVSNPRKLKLGGQFGLGLRMKTKRGAKQSPVARLVI